MSWLSDLFGGKKDSSPQNVSNPALDAYSSLISPARTQLMQYGQKNLGADPSQFYPDILKQGASAVSGQLASAQSPNNAPWNALRENLLGEFDRSFQQYTLNPAQERAKASGTYTGGEGANLLGSLGQQGAKDRATLGSNIDIQALQNQQQQLQQAISNAQSYGTTESNIAQQFTQADPLSDILGAYSMQPPAGAYQNGVQVNPMSYQQSVQGVPTVSQQNLGSLTSLLAPDLLKSLSSYLTSGTGSTGGNTSGGAIAGAIPSLLGALGGQGISSNYNPALLSMFANL